MNLKDSYIAFFVSKGHKQIPSAPIVPENDASVLFNTAGMQPLIPYLLGEVHPLGTRLCDYQKCVRTNDLDNVGDTYHHTFFEMLGNWSLGDYFKHEAINWSFEFLTTVLKLPVHRLAVTVFAGNDQIPFDNESYQLWLDCGITEKHIAKTSDDNFWIAAATGPCGPDTEMFYFRSDDEVPATFDPNDTRWVEIWNDVFMQYDKKDDGTYAILPKKNVDTGMGVERVTAILEGKLDNYESSLWTPTINLIMKLANKPYQGNETSMRIIADHMRTATFILADPAHIKPSNTNQGYIVRRLLRRAIRHAKKLGIDLESDWEAMIALQFIDQYQAYYPELKQNESLVLNELKAEKIKFSHTLNQGLKEFNKMIEHLNEPTLNQDLAFKLFDTYGFPIELTMELAKEKGITVDYEGFKDKLKAHQAESRTTSSGMFKGGLAGDSLVETRYHTATHLLNAALKQVLGKEVHQMGSNITNERMRFDFTHDQKVSASELTQVEALVNQYIQASLPVSKVEMSKNDAINSGAECMFIERYPDLVTVYQIGDVSKEICRGPHVNNTKELGHFKIIKEEASSAGVRRIKAILE